MSRKKTAVATAPAAPSSPKWLWPAALAAGAIVLAFIAYSPALRGPFLFDDLSLPFALPNASREFAGFVGQIRPVLMATYWVNYRLSGEDPASYHLFGLAFHIAASLLAFLAMRRLLERAGADASRRDLLAAIAAAVFLLHPVQTESVAYIAGRSECLSVMWLLAAYAVFLGAREALSWGRAAAVLALFVLGAASKEHIVALVPLLLLTDAWWSAAAPAAAVRRNWRLYAPMAAGALGAVAYAWHLIVGATTAGFALKDLPWYEYLFTQFRALFVYLRVFVLPVGLTVDYDFPFSKTILDHGAIVGLIGLLAISAAAWRFRREYRLAAFGWFAFLLLMAPTSSVAPIRDPIAERRLYLGMIGLLPIVLELLLRLKLDRIKLAAVLAAVALAGTAATYARASVWSSGLALWQDAVSKTPSKARPRFQLASAYYHDGRCDLAAAEFEATSKLQKPSYDLLVDWGMALVCMSQFEPARAKFQEAAALESTAHIWSQVAMTYANQSRWPEALDAIEKSLKIDPAYAVSWTYKGHVYLSTGDPAAAIQAYQRALAINDANEQARKGLAQAQEQLRRKQ